MDIIKIALYNYHKYRYLPHIILTQHWMNGDCKKINCNHINVEVNSVDRVISIKLSLKNVVKQNIITVFMCTERI